jgi:hypothetical protein
LDLLELLDETPDAVFDQAIAELEGRLRLAQS